METTVTKMPKAALHFMDHEGFAQVKDQDGEDDFQMVAYSGGIIEDHWYWGNLSIDLAGMSFPKKQYPILENHETSKKIAFAKKPDTSMGAIKFNGAQFVDTPESKEFRKLSKSGFPFEASIYASPTSVERLNKGEKAEVNGIVLKGPGTVWRKSTFKEASVCVFGYDTNTKSAAFASDEIEISLKTINNARSDQADKQFNEEVKEMNFEQLSKEHPELLAEIVTKTTDDVTKELSDKFDKEKTDLEDKLAQERDGRSDERKESKKEIAALQKSDAIRTEKELKSDAKEIWNEKLSESTIPDRLNDKVRNQVSHEDFIKDDQLDAEAFGKAVDAEIEDWESRGITSETSGFGVSVKEVEGESAKLKKEDQADEDLADEIFVMSGGKKEVK